MPKTRDRSAAAKLGWERRRDRARAERQRQHDWLIEHVTADPNVPPGMAMIINYKDWSIFSTTEAEVLKPMST